jgi:hypothetical protein
MNLKRFSPIYFPNKNQIMEIYLRDKAEMVYKSQNIPVDSLGVFKVNEEEWIYWYKDMRLFDTGSANSEPKAMQEATKYIKQINIRHDI